MNLKEASESGRKVRRIGWSQFHQKEKLSITYKDAIAEDWEVEQQETFTRSEVVIIVSKTIQSYSEFGFEADLEAIEAAKNFLKRIEEQK